MHVAAKPWVAVAFLLASAALAQPARAEPGARPAKADRVLILKGERRLLLFRRGQIFRSYRIALGRDPVGGKVRQGDGRTPEGRYTLDRRNGKSRFHRAIHISYPGPEDRRRASRLGVAPGGAIMIHGLPNGFGFIGAEHAKWDWTDGCIAVTDEEIDEIWSFVDDGTPIDIRP